MERIRSRAEEAYPEECCGFLTGFREPGPTVRILEQLPTANVAAEEDRRTTFLVKPKAVLEVVKQYRDRDDDVVGFYHSHPDHPAELSPTDLEFSRLWPRTVWLIVPVEDGSAGEARAWWLGERIEEPVAREAQDTKDVKELQDMQEVQEMIIRSSASADRATTPREERA